MLSTIEVLKEFEDAKALLKGHFILSSGLHSDTYLQCARIMMDAKRGEKLCAQLAHQIKQHHKASEFDMIVSPAMGGVIVGYELARQLDLPAIFCERVDGVFNIRRGFGIEPGAKILVVEDVLTTGKSSKETFDCIKEHGGVVVAEACLIDRSAGTSDLGIPLYALASLNIQNYDPNNLPEELKAIPAIKPGSRPNKK